MTSPSDLALVERLRRHDDAALDMLFARYAPALLRIAYRLSGALDDAEDVVQDVFIGLPLALRHYEEQGSFSAWLRTVTVRTALMHRRRELGRLRSVEQLSSEPPAATRQEPVIERMSLEAAIAKLPDALRHVFVLYHIEHFSHVEISHLLGIRRGTAEVRLHRAIRQLRSLLENER